MGLLGAIGFSIALLSLTQIPSSADGCEILSATPTGPSSILVKWEKHAEATAYILDLRIKNDTSVAPVAVNMASTVTQKMVRGLHPGTKYSVTLKVFSFFKVVCRHTLDACTVPDAAQILDGRSLTSTSIQLWWTHVPSTDHYLLQVYCQETGHAFNRTLADTGAVVEDLTPASNYDCYVTTLNEAGLGKMSKVRTVTTLDPPPAMVVASQTGRDSARLTWESVEDVLLYHVQIRDVDEPGSKLGTYNVSGTHLDVQDILPCSTYLMSVSSFSKFLVPSEPSNFTYTTNKLTPVSSVSVDYTCATHTATVRWSTVFGADSYQATAKSENGTQLMCTSQGTSCHIGGLSCGQTYTVHVTPMSENCKNTVNTTSATFQTVPCPPKNLELLRDCSSEVIVFSWETANNTDHYMAQAVDSQGVVQKCLTEDNSCYFTQTVCGRHYYFTVYAIHGDCKSEISSTVDIRTAPCIPQNVQTSASCNSDVLLSKWDLAEGALRYTVEAFGNKGNSYYNCSSLSNSCAIEGVHCGEFMTIYITAYDDECASPRTLGPVAETVPCTPHNVTAVKECGADAVTVTWSVSGSTLFYVAMAVDGDGNVHSCNSMDMTCRIEGLKCSTVYSAYVIGSNFMCNSTKSEVVTVETAACPPDHVASTLDCAANEALISWHGRPEMNSFTATIVDENQVLLSCSSTSSNCSISNLNCGQLYTVTVSHHDGICPSMPSEPIHLQSVPCGPHIDAHLDCQSQVLNLGWKATSKADSYMAVVSDGAMQTSYNTTEPRLSINTLDCGQDYTLKVMSVHGTCVSHPSMLPLSKMPCVPTNVMVHRVCEETSVFVSWQAGAGALYHKATAMDGDGHQLTCMSNGTGCMLEGLTCSQTYNVTVVAGHDTCTSNKSAVVMVHAAPCPPSQLNAKVNCANNSVTLTWRGNPNTLSYVGRAECTKSGHTVAHEVRADHSCQLDGLHCGFQLDGLRCGTEYNFTVSASDEDCVSRESAPVVLMTAPCVVSDVVNALDCGSNTLTVSWQAAFMPVSYRATALAGNGAELRCVTENSTCTLTDLRCGEQYKVSVAAVGGTCVTHGSASEVVNSAPCVPANVQGVLECSSNTLQASWHASGAATSYISTLTQEGRFSASHLTTDPSSLFSGLQCAHTYMLSVAAQSGGCNSSGSAEIPVVAAPCDPTDVVASLDCASGVATVTWAASAGAQRYTVLAKAGAHVDSCTSPGTSCQLGRLQCGEDYTVTVLAGDRTCNSTFMAKTNLTTAPCAPVIHRHGLDCASNQASVTWEQDDDAISVRVFASSSLGHSASCVSNGNSSCVLSDLLCGHTYSGHAVAQGAGCPSLPSAAFLIHTAPCTPANVEHQFSCETGIALLTWDETLGRRSFHAYVSSGDHMTSCSSNSTDCSLPPLLCGRTYDVKVVAVADHCNSSVAGAMPIETAPCPPTNITASLICDNNTAEVSWQPSAGATSYNVTALGRDGDAKWCNTSDSVCLLSNMHCAVTYVITVTPLSERCKGAESLPHLYMAGPCPPSDVHAVLQCHGNVGHVTWNAEPHADHYLVTGDHPPGHTEDEHSHNCTSSGTGCSLSDLHCSETVVVTVVTVERGCHSEPSAPFVFQSVICPPTGLMAQTACGSNDITVGWEQRPESDVTYFLHAQQDGAAAATNTTTAETSRVLSGLQCGERFTLSVAAQHGGCSSVLSETIEADTAPCPPTNLMVETECGTNLGNLAWAASEHARSYTATVSGTHGHVASCSSNSTACSVKLDCGHQYTAVVLASSSMCNSSSGPSVSFESAPCLPDRVTAQLTCSDNSLAVQWRGSDGDVGSYTAMAIGSDQSRQTCDTGDTSCNIQNLQCGLTYSVVVTTSSVDCGTITGSDYMIQSAPCEPNDVMVNLQCSSNSATVTWGNAGPDQTHVVSAVDSQGLETTFNSSSSSWTFEQLECGETYTISVVGHTQTCSSRPAVAAQLITAPCVPTHLTARADCATGITVVTWDSARGATSYTVYARGSLGHYAECNSTDTNCDFPNLACGQDYDITVVARHHGCASAVSQTINATTGPCPHTGLAASLDCATNTALLSWTPGSGILYYNASASGFTVAHTESCTTAGASCNISSLHCGESYKVSVSGQGHMCPSPAQDWHRIDTAPCPPTQLRVESSCESNNISVSWQASQGSVSYTAVAEDAGGQRWSCNTSSTGCHIGGLPCGQRYQVYAVGVSDDCVGARSNVGEVQTAPCVPQDVQTHLDCLAGVLNVTWQSTGHAPRFRASVVSSEGHVSVCDTDMHECVVHGLRCGLTYSVAVAAADGACNSSSSVVKQVTAAPCPLSSFLPTVDCSSGGVSVSWNGSVAGVTYLVSANDSAGRQHNCSSSVGGGCDLNTLECGTNYSVTITPSRGECVGRDSAATTVTTVPCVPRLSNVEIDCLTNSAWLKLEEAAGAEDYIVMATDSQGDAQTFPCQSTSDGVCALPPLACSRNFTFTLKAHDQQCSSAASNAVTTETAPCPPEGVTKSVSCDNNTASISWSAVPGALTYTATLERLTGGTVCCTTPHTSCDIAQLPCGEMYILLVSAEGSSCNSSQSEGDIVNTVPCVPQNLQADLSCRDNVASMTWNHSRGGQLYRVTAASADGHVDECTNFENRCSLTGLRCGMQYTATVTAEHIDCRSQPSESVTFKTAPCTPASVSSAVDCDASTLMVSWSESPGADSYMATVEDSTGHTTGCQGTTEGSCSISGVGCGQIYHVSVVSSDGYCDSPPTDVVRTPAAPCEPRHITAAMDCFMQTAVVSWYPSPGALSYTVAAETGSGHNVSCEAAAATQCELGGLLCGQSYSVCVTAVGQNCSTVAYMMETLVTEPCVPAHITTEYSLTIGQVLWDRAAGAESYSVEGLTEQGLMVSCLTNDTYCAIYNLQCGQTYSVNVTANNQVCQGVSTSAETALIQTEPCPPNDVQVGVKCPSNTGMVTWEASIGAVAYEARLAGRDGHSLSCYTNETFCHVEGLHCGIVYYTNVVAIGETLNSSSSTTVLLTSAPCTAADVVAALDCYNNSVEVSWSAISGADSVVVMAVSAEGQRASCASEGLGCELTELQCGQMYNVSLTAVSEHCQTQVDADVSFYTRPCKPMVMGSELHCGTGTAKLYWEERDDVELYMATAVCSMGTIQRCNSTDSLCSFSNLACGETYQLSVTAYSHMCGSEVSSTEEIRTDPCQPADVRVDGSCDNETVTVSWSLAKGASVYMVTASGDLGYVTAFHTQELSIDAELPCGQEFNFTVKARGDQCDGAASEPEMFKTGPCVPHHVQSYTQCEDSLGSVSWARSDGAESYMAIAMAEDGHTHVCTTNTTTCTWDDLHCGETYAVQVIASDYMCDSEPSNSTTIRMASCIPQNLQASMNCTMKVGSLTWNASETADFYIVTAETNAGHRVQLSTNNTWSYISEFQCGEEYFLSVQAADSVCTSRPSEALALMSEPCPPTAVSSLMNCLSNIAMVSWAASAGAVHYTATVTQEDGQSQSCWSDTQQCGMPNLACGQNYTVTVVAHNDNCNSDPSEGDALPSVPCVPTDVEVEVDCGSGEATASWSASPGALSYKASARSTLGDVSTCETDLPTCTLSNLTCGRTYWVQVVAQDDTCSSLPSPATELKSVPCTPDIGSVLLDCFTKSAVLDWSFAEGALRFSAVARSLSGHVSTCTTNHTNCELMDLRCGETYEVHTVATNEYCSSSPSDTLQLDSVPCPPEEVVPLLDCSTNTARVEWQAGAGASSYVVQAFGVQEDMAECETESNACVLPDLLCGFTYNISVVAVSNQCNTSRSTVTQLQTVPCVPQQVEARVVCESEAVAVSWEPSAGALSYTVVAQGGGGYASMCNSSDTTCLLSDLLCGLNYSVSVSAADMTCASAGSAAVDISTVPCVPQKVMAEMECGSDTGVVWWEEGEGVPSYMVTASGPNGHRDQCNSTGTSCRLPSMQCGQLYNLTVTALDGECDNSRAFLSLQSVPCRPTNVQASLLCRANSAAVTWERSSGATSFRAVGVSSDGAHRSECNNTASHCDLSRLRCGQTYNVSVSGLDQSCSSVESDTAYVRTAPCPPHNVAVESLCEEGALSVSWSPNPDAHHFQVLAVSNTGARHHCNTSGVACTITDLPCGRSYNVSVVAVRDDCESEPSPSLETASVPCEPTSPTSRLDCVTNSAWVSWTTSNGALSYSVLAQAADGHNSSCSSAASTCNVPDLKCGTHYTFHVTALNKHCRSNHSQTFGLETGPCALSTISATTQCNSDTILVEWEMSTETPHYLVSAEGHDGSLLSCDSNATYCLLRDVRCGTQYSIIVSASSDKCRSLRSPPKKIKTAPCPPSGVTAVPLCEENGVTVTWADSAVASSYMLTASGQDGHVVTCDTAVSNCTLAQLHCGQPYSLSVTASMDNCTSAASMASFSTVPCAPGGLSVDVECETQTAVLSWDASEGAAQYFGCARPADGGALYCNSSDMTCTIEGLQCGQVYNFSVEASDGVCNSSFSPPLEQGAAPCAPTDLTARMQEISQSHWLMTSWAEVDCPGVEYLVEISGQIQNSPQSLMSIMSYWLPRPYFETLMPCSTAYNLAVRSRNDAGVSELSDALTGVTVPCPPQNLRYTGSTRSAVLSWDASVFATAYTVYSVLAGGGRGAELCTTSDLSCTLSAFNPDAVQVTASNANGESVPNQNVTGPVGSRRRRDLRASQVHVNDENDMDTPQLQDVTHSGRSLRAQWTATRGATEYVLLIGEEQQSSDQTPVVRVVEGEAHVEKNLNPHATYCVRVAARNAISQSSFSRLKCTSN